MKCKVCGSTQFIKFEDHCECLFCGEEYQSDDTTNGQDTENNDCENKKLTVNNIDEEQVNNDTVNNDEIDDIIIEDKEIVAGKEQVINDAINNDEIDDDIIEDKEIVADEEQVNDDTNNSEEEACSEEEELEFEDILDDTIDTTQDEFIEQNNECNDEESNATEGVSEDIEETNRVHITTIEDEILKMFEEERREDAIKLLDTTDINDINACNLIYYYIGECFDKGKGVEKNDNIANRYYELAMNNEPCDNQYYMGMCYFKLGNLYIGRGDSDKANILYNNAMNMFNNSDDVRAYAFMGIMFKKGLGVAVSVDNAVECFKNGAKNGDSKAIFYLGKCYEKGYGMPMDELSMVNCYTRAASMGFDIAMCNLGVCLYYGKGIAKDLSGAIEWYKKAIEKGNVTAKYNLAKIYINNNMEEEGYSMLDELVQEGYTPAVDFLSHK